MLVACMAKAGTSLKGLIMNVVIGHLASKNVFVKLGKHILVFRKNLSENSGTSTINILQTVFYYVISKFHLRNIKYVETPPYPRLCLAAQCFSSNNECNFWNIICISKNTEF